MWRTTVAVLFAACVPVSQPLDGPVPSSLMREHDLLAPVWIQTGKPDSEIGGGVSGGDVNGDGYNDVVIGSNDVRDEDWLLVFHGSSTGLGHHPASSFDIAGKLGSFNHSKFAGDVNADGFDDVIVSDP